MKKRLLGIVTALVLSTASVAAIAPVANAAILYECRKYDWFYGWKIVHTVNYQFYQSKGYTCVCIGTI